MGLLLERLKIPKANAILGARRGLLPVRSNHRAGDRMPMPLSLRAQNRDQLLRLEGDSLRLRNLRGIKVIPRTAALLGNRIPVRPNRHPRLHDLRPINLQRLPHGIDRERNPKPDYVARGRWVAEVAIRRPAVERGLEPTAAPDHVLGTGGRWTAWVDRGLFLELAVVGRIPTVLYPFANIAVNVEQTKGIRFQLARGVRPTAGVSTKPPRPYHVFVLVTNPILRGRSCATRKFPLRLGGESITGPVQRRDGFTSPEVGRYQLLLLA